MAELAGLPEQVRPDLAAFKVSYENALRPAREQPREIGLAHGERQLAKVLTEVEEELNDDEPARQEATCCVLTVFLQAQKRPARSSRMLRASYGPAKNGG